MKRNHPPDNRAELPEEQKIVQQRLRETFLAARARKVLHSNKGTWCQINRHVQLDPATNHQQYDGMVRFSKELERHYLGAHEALYLLESRQLVIHFNELPLSLAEAYQLLLEEVDDFRNYIVFLHLNRWGYFCLKPDPRTLKTQDGDHARAPQHYHQLSNEQNPEQRTESLVDITLTHKPFDEVLEDLRNFGPKELRQSDDATSPASGNPPITFDVYKRETFAKNRPRKGKPGRPDHFVIVCDESDFKPSSYGNPFVDGRSIEEESSERLLYALVDADANICFARFKPIDPTSMGPALDRWPEPFDFSKIVD